MINFIREIIKDLEDKKGDESQGMKTLPIVLGLDKTSKLAPSYANCIPCSLYQQFCGQ
jgi:4-hydroxybenzoate polyprenyltransferase